MRRNLSKLGIIGAAAISIASLGIGATPQVVPASSQSQNTQHNEAIDKQIAPAKVQKRDLLQPSGAFLDSESRPPKMYGQWLQFKGLQKWNKRK